MGYTHYWRGGKVDADVWTKITTDVNKLIEQSEVPLQHEYDEPGTKPLVNEETIFFNGAGDDGHETFFIKPTGTDFEFCKTAYKPYDKIVTAVLAVIKEHAGDAIRVSSDGDEKDWQEGLAYAKKVLGRDVAYPIKHYENGDF